jgi:hypothetical protein
LVIRLISIPEQLELPTTSAQVAALRAAQCDQIFREKASGDRWDRPEFHRLLDRLRQGDVLIVWKLDRLSRSLRDLVMIMERLGEMKAGCRSLTEAIDTTTPAGRMMMQMVGADAARPFRVHPAIISRILARTAKPTQYYARSGACSPTHIYRKVTKQAQ